MKIIIGLLAFFVFDGTGVAAEILNPHYEDHCESCHLRLPAKGSGGIMDYSFVAEEIDPTCMRCHSDNCCDIGSKEHTHASGIDTWDKEKYGVPDELPLQDGYITCVTCHYYIRKVNPGPRDYKLVRLVKFTENGIDWTGLCTDCHKND